MRKSRTPEEDKTSLHKKVGEQQNEDLGAEESLALRRLLKRLKLVQRKLRLRVARKAQSAGKKAASAS